MQRYRDAAWERVGVRRVRSRRMRGRVGMGIGEKLGSARWPKFWIFLVSLLGEPMFWANGGSYAGGDAGNWWRDTLTLKVRYVVRFLWAFDGESDK